MSMSGLESRMQESREALLFRLARARRKTASLEEAVTAEIEVEQRELADLEERIRERTETLRREADLRRRYVERLRSLVEVKARPVISTENRKPYETGTYVSIAKRLGVGIVQGKTVLLSPAEASIVSRTLNRPRTLEADQVAVLLRQWDAADVKPGASGPVIFYDRYIRSVLDNCQNENALFVALCEVEKSLGLEPIESKNRDFAKKIYATLGTAT